MVQIDNIKMWESLIEGNSVTYESGRVERGDLAMRIIHALKDQGFDYQEGKIVETKQQSCSEDLEKVSKEYADKNYAEWLDFCSGEERDDHYLISEAFKAGAQWQKQQTIAKACEWLRSRLDINVDIKTDSDGHPLADSYMNYAQKRLEAADNFVDAFKEAMRKED